MVLPILSLSWFSEEEVVSSLRHYLEPRAYISLILSIKWLLVIMTWFRKLSEVTQWSMWLCGMLSYKRTVCFTAI